MTARRKKLIEVALPLGAINAASAREKSIRHGHPSTLHLWWARRPLAACRAVLFAQMVDDPSSAPEEFPDEVSRERERRRLFGIVERLVKWENSNDPRAIGAARREIARSVARGQGVPPPRTRAEVDAFLAEHAPPVLDPFCGGGSIPLEAQRLGLRAHGSDLNPVAVLITKALVELPPRFAGLPPVNPEARTRFAAGAAWNGRGAEGLAEDVRHYGRWMRDEAARRIGHLYPKARLPDGSEANAIAWLWARTVASPNPAAGGAHVPLVRSFVLSSKKGKEAWVEPVVDSSRRAWHFTVRSGSGSPPEGTVGRRGGRCLLTGAPMPFGHIRSEGRAGRMGQQLMAVVAEGAHGRAYLDPTAEMEETARPARRRPAGSFPRLSRRPAPDPRSAACRSLQRSGAGWRRTATRAGRACASRAASSCGATSRPACSASAGSADGVLRDVPPAPAPKPAPPPDGTSSVSVTAPFRDRKNRPGASPLDPGGKEVRTQEASSRYRVSVRATRKP